jgi:hypothetical protein
VVLRSQEVAGVSDEQHRGRPAGRWAIAVASALLAGGGFVGAGGFAYAGDDPDNVGAPGGDGQDVTCIADQPPANVAFCNVVGEDGADGRSSTVHG